MNQAAIYHGGGFGGCGGFNGGDYNEYVPIVTLVGGAGNVVPQYSENKGRYSIVSRTCFIEISLTGDGGNEGAGTGQINISLPIQASIKQLNVLNPCGDFYNGTLSTLIFASIISSANTITLSFFGTLLTISPVSGGSQSNVNRGIRLTTFYEV